MVPVLTNQIMAELFLAAALGERGKEKKRT